jgi:hypothetical protein
MDHKDTSELPESDAALLDLGVVMGQAYAFALVAGTLFGCAGGRDPPHAR